jgi:hypothetical protein
MLNEKIEIILILQVNFFELNVKKNKLRLIEHCKYKNNNIKKNAKYL